VALPVKALKAGQESYWLDQIARNREEYFSGKGESPGRFVGEAAAASGLAGEAAAEQVHAMFRGLDPATGAQRCKPLLRADPRSKLAAAPLLATLKARAAEQSITELEQLAASKALAGDVRSVQAACKLGGSKRVKVETVERVCRKVLGIDPHELYGEAFVGAWRHRGKRVDERVAALDHCFSSPKSVSLLAGTGGEAVRQQVQDARGEALRVALGYLERHGVGVRREHNGTDRYLAKSGLFGIAFQHRISRAGDPQYHTHVLVQNAAKGPDGHWTALDSDRLYAHLMAADRVYLAAERAALSERLGVRWTPVDQRSGAAEILGLDDRALIERFSKRSSEIDDWLDTHGMAGIKASSAAAVATRAPKDHSEDEQSVYARWTRELAEAGVGERELAMLGAHGRGRAARPEQIQAALDALAGPEGLTAQAGTFTRADVVDQLAKRLPVAASAETCIRQLEEVADRFLAERAVPVARDQRLGVQRYSTPELLGLEQRLLGAAVQRADDGCAVVRPQTLRLVLERHPTRGADQEAMVRDVCQSGAGVSLVVGRAGTGKTWALGLAREAFELDGYQVIGTAPTGIATVSLQDEGFADVRTVDRLLLDLRHGRLELDSQTVLVVDEAGMVGTRKLTPLLDHARRAGAKVIPVGDDRQFSSIDTGGGFRALRLRLGASELTVNRRQVQEWEQRAIDLVRDQRVEEAIAVYAEHERIRAFESRDELALALVDQWWQAHQNGEDAGILAHRRAEVDRLNSVCQQLRDKAGQLGPERLQVGDRQVAVGDRVVLGANALGRLGVANGTTGTVVGVDTRRRTLSLRTDDDTPRTLQLPGWYLDAKGRPGASRRVDLAYARTDMRSQGLTKRRALLLLDGCEDTQGLYVQLSRAKQRTDLFMVVGPEPLGPDEEAPHPRARREPLGADDLLARIMARDGAKTLASDTAEALDPRRRSTRWLREERDRLQALRAQCPTDRARELTVATRRAGELEEARRQALADLETTRAEASGARGRAARLAACDRLALAEHRAGTLTRQADQAAERVGMLRRHQQARASWLEANDAELTRHERVVARELGWRRRVDERAVALDPPTWLVAELGPVPEQPAEREAWLQAAAELDAYRRVHGLPEPAERAQRGGGSSERDRDTTRIERTRDDPQDERVLDPGDAAGRDSDRDRPRPQHGEADRDPRGGSAVDSQRITQDGQDECAEPSRPALEDRSRPAHEEPPGPARPAAPPAPGRVSRPAPERPGWHRRQRGAGDTTQDRPAAPDREPEERARPALGGRLDAVLGCQPGRDRPGQRRDWHAVRAALERLAEQRERLRRGDRQDRAGRPGRDQRQRQDSDRHERDGR
jgi:conjugative relaxase-like TrwC/TraI family protein